MRISAIIVSVILCLFLSGCEEDTNKYLAGGSDGGPDGANESTTQLATQTLEVVKYKNMMPWISSHTSVIIDSIAPIDRGGNGYTIGYIIVYRDTVIEKKIEKTLKTYNKFYKNNY